MTFCIFVLWAQLSMHFVGMNHAFRLDNSTSSCCCCILSINSINIRSLDVGYFMHNRHQTYLQLGLSIFARLKRGVTSEDIYKEMFDEAELVETRSEYPFCRQYILIYKYYYITHWQFSCLELNETYLSTDIDKTILKELIAHHSYSSSTKVREEG